MTEQSTLTTLLLVKLDTDRLWIPVVGQLWTLTVFRRTRMAKYPHPHICVNEIKWHWQKISL